jgi:hypothetical protein
MPSFPRVVTLQGPIGLAVVSTTLFSSHGPLGRDCHPTLEVTVVIFRLHEGVDIRSSNELETSMDNHQCSRLFVHFGHIPFLTHVLRGWRRLGLVLRPAICLVKSCHLANKILASYDVDLTSERTNPVCRGTAIMSSKLTYPNVGSPFEQRTKFNVVHLERRLLQKSAT